MKIKSQSSIEFLILVGVIFFFFLGFLIAIQTSINDKVKEKNNLLLKNTAYKIQDEINFASESSDGYEREFKIPDKIGSKDYDIDIIANMVYLKTIDNKNSIALPIPVITGNIIKGDNLIKKINNTIYLN